MMRNTRVNSQFDVSEGFSIFIGTQKQEIDSKEREMTSSKNNIPEY